MTKQETMTTEQFKAAIGRHKVFAGDTPVKQRLGQNKTEAAFEVELSFLFRAGQLTWYAFQPITLKLAADCRYTTDFVVVLTDGTIEFIEIKGRKGASYYSREDSIIKIKVAARTYPMFRFSIRWPLNGGGWARENY